MRRLRGRTLGCFVLLFALLLQGCSQQNGTNENGAGKPIHIPIIDDVQIITVKDRDGNMIAEHRDPVVVQQLLQGIKDAQSSYIGEPEEYGVGYSIVLTGRESSLTYEVNDLRSSNGFGASAKIYATLPKEERASAWELGAAWIQRLLDPNVEKEAAILHVSVDEDSDRVILVGTQDIDRISLAEAIESNLFIQVNQAIAPKMYSLKWTDARRVVIVFPELSEGAMVELILDGTKTSQGQLFEVRAPQDRQVITIRQGIAWSGLRWVDLLGRTVYEHGFATAAMIQPSRELGDRQEILIYNREGTTYLVRPVERDIMDITQQGPNDQDNGNVSDTGVSVLYSYASEQGDYYMATGFRTIHRVSETDGTSKRIYETDRLLYGMAASPNGRYLALLVDSEGNLRSSADLIIIDANGKLVSSFAKASYAGHSDGWHLVYPLTWVDAESVAVPLIASSGESFNRGRAVYHYEKGLLSKQADATTLPEDALALLQAQLGQIDASEIVRALPKPDDDVARYYAVFVSGWGSYLIDREKGTVVKLGTGPLIGWVSQEQVVVWHSTEGKTVEYVGVE